MKQSEFEKKYEAFWQGIEEKLLISTELISAGRETKKKSLKLKKRLKASSDLGEDFPENFRLLCHHLSLSRSRHYSPLLVERLEKLVINAHQIYYKRKTHLLTSVLLYFTSGFSQSVRNEWRWVLISSVLFFGTFFGMLITLQYYPDMVYTVISGEQLAQNGIYV